MRCLLDSLALVTASLVASLAVAGLLFFSVVGCSERPEPRHPQPVAPQPLAPLPDARPTLIIFSARWCAPCRLLHETTLRDSRVIAAMSRFQVRTVDVDVDRTTAGEHRVNAVPCYIVIRNGSTIRGEGYLAPRDFLLWLENAEH